MKRRKPSEESRTIERFRARYGRAGTRAERAIERAAIGANVGANGYTTVAQAALLARLLKLKRGVRLLDIGCGRGYPGLYLARASGCSVVGTDLPLASLRIARDRSWSDRTYRRVSLIAASALQLPFRRASFDAIVHTDVMCWLKAKLSVLRACHDLLVPGGRIAFTTIHPAPDISERDHRRVVRARGRGGADRRDMAGLLRAAGFVDVRARDVSREFGRTSRALLETADTYAAELRGDWGDERFRESQRDRRQTTRLIDEEVLRRSIFTAQKPR